MGKNKSLHVSNHQIGRSDRSFPNIFGITTTAELQERGALGGSVVQLALRLFPYLCLEPSMAGRFEKGDKIRDLSWRA